MTPEQRAELEKLNYPGFAAQSIENGKLAREMRRLGWIEFHDQLEGMGPTLWSITEEGRKALEEGR